MNEREEMAEHALQLKARQAMSAHNASQYIVLALREMAILPLNEWTVDSQAMLGQAHSNFQSLIKSLQPKAERKPKGKGKIIDIEFYPDPCTEELAAGCQTGY